MTEIQDPLVPGQDDVRLLVEDLACVSGRLSEIMTAWRRAMPGRPELPLSGLTRIQDATRQLTADIGTAARAGLRPDLSVAERLSALSEDIADIRATTRTPGTSEVVDHGLWKLIAAAMRRARAHLTNLMPVGGPGRLRPDGPDIPSSGRSPPVSTRNPAEVARSSIGTASACRLAVARECRECRLRDGRKSATSRAPPGRSTR